jgi:uncharacterized protein YaiE (UPF0345 family)
MVREDRSEQRRQDASRRRFLLGTGALAATGLAGCTQIRNTIGNRTGGVGGSGGDGGGGGDAGTPTVDPGPDVTSLTPADCEPEVISDDIEADTTWDTADCPRVALDGNVRVTNGATLTVEPGVEVVGRSGARLTVKGESTLAASGGPENPVWFHGESDTPGYWQGIRIRSSTASELDNVVVAHGGANGWANVYLDGGAQAAVTNVRSEQSATAGLVAESGATLSAFAANEFRANEGAAVSVPTTVLDSVDTGSSYTGNNDVDAVRVFSEDVEDDATWAGVPYYFDGSNHRLFGAVSVDPGAQFTLGEGARVTVKEGGSFTAEGTSDSPIAFEGETATPGYWQGIRIRSNNPDNSFDNVVIAHGGANGWANVYLDGGAQAAVTNSTFRQSATAGLVAESGVTLSAFATNEFRANEGAAVSVPTTVLGSVDAESTYVADNGTDAVRVFDEDVEDDATWAAVPYYFDGSNHRFFGAVSVDPGAQFTFGEGARITVKEGGSFAAEGSSDSPIAFEGATASPGHWQGIRIRSNNPDNSFDNVVVAHGGASGWANVYVGGGAQAAVTNSTLRQSATWALYAEDGATLDSSNNTYENNGEGGVRTPQSG